MRTLDSEYGPNAEAKNRLQTIEALARKLQAVLLSQDVRHFYDQELMPPRLADLADCARRAYQDIPRAWREWAPRDGASRLRAAFADHGLHFSASIDGVAVAELLKVARMAGDRRMSMEAARKWIGWAIRVHKFEQKSRERIEQN